MGAAELSFIVKAIDQASGTLKGVGSELENMEGKASKLGSMLKGGLMLGAGVAVAGVGALGAVLKQSVDEASAAEQITAQLNAVIKSTGGVAGVTAAAINEHALALSQMTRYEDDAIVEADSLLLTFTKIGKDTFPKATELTLDLATAFKMDLKSAALMVGKALNDPVKGLTAMGRAGVQFSDSQKEMIKAMVEAGDVAGAQRIIMAELETQVGGSAKAAGETMAGQMDILKNSIGNVKEEIGGALLPVIEKLVTWIGPKLVAGFQGFSDWVQGGVLDVKLLAGRFENFKDILSDIVIDIKSGAKIDWQDLLNLSGLFTDDYSIQRKFAKIATDIQTGIGQLKTAFEDGGIGGLFAEAWRMIGDWWTTDAVPFAAELGGKIKTWWDGTLVPWLKTNTPSWSSIGLALQGAWNTLATFWETEAVPFATQVANSISAWWTGQVIPVLQTKAPEWAASLNAVLKKVVTIGAWQIGDDASLAYTLGAAWTKLMIASFKPLAAGPGLLIDALKKAFAGGLGEANWGEIFGNIFGPIGDFLSGALDAFLLEMGGDFAQRIADWWAGIWASVTGMLGGGGSSGAGGGAPQRSQTRSLAPAYAPASTPSNAFNVTININAPGGNPRAVALAAQNGMLSAARSMGLA